MPGGKVDHVLVRPLDLAANTLVYGVAHIKALFVIVALPEALRIAAYFANDAADQTIEPSQVLPDWVMGLVSYGISAVVITGIIRYVALAEGPYWFPKQRLVRNYLLAAAILVIGWSIVGFATGDYLFGNFANVYLSGPPFDELRYFWFYTAHSWLGFLIAVLFIAAIYPIFGMIAVQQRLDVHRLLRWDGKYYWRFLALSFLLVSLCLVLRRAYWWLLNTLAPGLTTDVYYVEHENVRTLVEQMTEVPMDILFDIVPAVAIGLLFKVLRASSADL